MAAFILALFALPFIFALIISWHRGWGALRRSALNPMLLIAFFVLFAGADFFLLGLTGTANLGGHLRHVDGLDLAMTAAQYVGLLMAFLGGIWLVYQSPAPPVAPRRGPRVEMRKALLAGHLVVLALWVWAILPYSPDFFSVEGSVITKYNAGNDPTVYTLSLLLIPTTAYALRKQPFAIALGVTLLTAFLVFFSGARTKVLVALIPILFYLVLRRWPMPRVYFPILIGIAIVLSLLAVNVRQVVTGQRSGDIGVELVGAFETDDFAVADIAVLQEGIPQKRLSDYPGENVVSALTAPFPRELVPFKPLSGTVQFTRAFDPQRWRLHRSGLVPGFINEFSGDYPYPIAAILLGLLGAGWAWAFRRATQSTSIHAFAWTVSLYVALFNLFRNDLFITFGPLWAMLVYSAAVAAWRGMLVLGVSTRGKRILPGASPLS